MTDNDKRGLYGADIGWLVAALNVALLEHDEDYAADLCETIRASHPGHPALKRVPLKIKYARAIERATETFVVRMAARKGRNR